MRVLVALVLVLASAAACDPTPDSDWIGDYLFDLSCDTEPILCHAGLQIRQVDSSTLNVTHCINLESSHCETHGIYNISGIGSGFIFSRYDKVYDIFYMYGRCCIVSAGADPFGPGRTFRYRRVSCDSASSSVPLLPIIIVIAAVVPLAAVVGICIYLRRKHREAASEMSVPLNA